MFDRTQIQKGLRILGKDAVELASFMTLRLDGVQIPGAAEWSSCGCFIGVVTAGGELAKDPWGPNCGVMSSDRGSVTDAVRDAKNGIKAIYDAHMTVQGQNMLRAEVERYVGWRPWEVSVEEAGGAPQPTPEGVS